MEPRWQRTALVELVGTFGLVVFSAGVVCVNQMTTPASTQPAGVTPLTLHQPGLVGVALAQGLSLAVLLSLTVPVSGGWLNPAIVLMLWAFGRLPTGRAGILLAAQLLGSLAAAVCLRLVFSADVVQGGRFGAPHVNPLAYPVLSQYTLLAGIGVELLLTFFLTYAMLAVIGPTAEPLRLGLAPGMVQAAAALFAYPLTGAALNPARWVGPVVCEALGGPDISPWADLLVYLAGPILGALLGGAFYTRLIAAAPATGARR